MTYLVPYTLVNHKGRLQGLDFVQQAVLQEFHIGLEF